MVVTVDENELKLVLERLDTVKLELLRLRAMLLPEEKATAEDKKSIVAAKKEIRAGKTANLQEFVEELGC
ncbi:MAG: hypothetical protein M1540_02805 [Candidatus Bathyarchaeota archaeon]|nr:hypothetical protein [Candidatus Bathyarchaeota archaeon]